MNSSWKQLAQYVRMDSVSASLDESRMKQDSKVLDGNKKVV